MKMFLILICSFILFIDGPRSRADEAALARFRTEYPVASKHVVERLADKKGFANLKILINDKIIKETNIEFQTTREFQKFATRGAGGRNGDRSGVIYRWGDDLAFTLRRESNGGGLRVISRGNGVLARQTHERIFGRYLCAPYSVFLMRPLAEMLNNPHVEDLTAESVLIDGRKCVRIHFLRGTEHKLDVTVDLDPSLGWVIVGASIRHGVGSHVLTVFRNRYDLDRRHWPMPRSVEVKDIDNSVARCEFQSIEFAPSPPEEFAMSYYGLPDLPGTPKREPTLREKNPPAGRPANGSGRTWWRSSIFLGLVSIAAAGLVAGFFLRRAAARAEEARRISG